MKLQWKNAVVRAVRTFAQTFAAGLLALPVAEALSDVRVVGTAMILVLWSAFLAGLVSLSQNLVEDSTSLSMPK